MEEDATLVTHDMIYETDKLTFEKFSRWSGLPVPSLDRVFFEQPDTVRVVRDLSTVEELELMLAMSRYALCFSVIRVSKLRRSSVLWSVLFTSLVSHGSSVRYNSECSCLQRTGLCILFHLVLRTKRDKKNEDAFYRNPEMSIKTAKSYLSFLQRIRKLSVGLRTS